MGDKPHPISEDANAAAAEYKRVVDSLRKARLAMLDACMQQLEPALNEYLRANEPIDIKSAQEMAKSVNGTLR